MNRVDIVIVKGGVLGILWDTSLCMFRQKTRVVNDVIVINVELFINGETDGISVSFTDEHTSHKLNVDVRIDLEFLVWLVEKDHLKINFLEAIHIIIEWNM